MVPATWWDSCASRPPACIAAKVVSFLDVMVRAIRVDLLWRQAQDGKATKGKPVMLKSLSTALILRGIGAVALGIMAFGISDQLRLHGARDHRGGVPGPRAARRVLQLAAAAPPGGDSPRRGLAMAVVNLVLRCRPGGSCGSPSGPWSVRSGGWPVAVGAGAQTRTSVAWR